MAQHHHPQQRTPETQQQLHALRQVAEGWVHAAAPIPVRQGVGGHPRNLATEVVAAALTHVHMRVWIASASAGILWMLFAVVRLLCSVRDWLCSIFALVALVAGRYQWYSTTVKEPPVLRIRWVSDGRCVELLFGNQWPGRSIQVDVQ